MSVYFKDFYGLEFFPLKFTSSEGSQGHVVTLCRHCASTNLAALGHAWCYTSEI